MSFRQFGGLQFASKHNAVASYYNTSSNLLVTQNVGQPNSYITFLSDISGNITIYGFLDISGNLHVTGEVDISGNLHVTGDIDCSGNGSFDNSIYIRDGSYYSVISENGSTLNLVNHNTGGYININPNGQTGITVNNSGKVGIKNTNPQGTLDVTGNLITTMDASINSITVGTGGGNVTTNTAIGASALASNTTGNNNTAIGFNAGFNNLSGTCNTFLGSNADISSNTLSYDFSTAIGYNSKINNYNQIVLGGLPFQGAAYPTIKIPGSYVGIGGNYNPGNGYALDVLGNVNATSYNSASDYRIKENITQLDGKFVVDKLNPVTYLNKKSDKQDIGLIAHELQEIYPELVNGEKDGEQLQSVNYLGLIPILIKEIKELKKEIKSVKDELNELKNK